jgi:hypothetical protein
MFPVLSMTNTPPSLTANTLQLLQTVLSLCLHKSQDFSNLVLENLIIYLLNELIDLIGVNCLFD